MSLEKLAEARTLAEEKMRFARFGARMMRDEIVALISATPVDKLKETISSHWNSSLGPDDGPVGGQVQVLTFNGRSLEALIEANTDGRFDADIAKGIEHTATPLFTVKASA